MVHVIEFRWVILAQVDRPDYSDQQQVVIKKGTRLHTHIKPYVIESPDGPVEVADLYLDDGSVARGFDSPPSSSLTVPKAAKRK